MSRGRILVIRGGALGDFVVTLPVLRALGEQFPSASVDLLAYPQMAGLASASQLAEQCLHIESRSLAGFFARHGELDASLSAQFADYHMVVSYLYDPDEIFRQNFSRTSKAQFLQGIHRPDDHSDTPASISLLKALEQVAIFDADPVPRLDLQAASVMDRRRIAIHPGSGSPRKNWPPGEWKEMLQILTASLDLSFCLLSGPAEGDWVREWAQTFPADRVQVLQNKPLPEVAQALRACAFYLGHDSGISHLATALGLRGYLLWGASNPRVWGPLRPEMKLIHAASGLLDLTAASVAEAVIPDLLQAGFRSC